MEKFRVSHTFMIEEYSTQKYAGIAKLLELTGFKVGVTIREKECETTIILYTKSKVTGRAKAQISLTVVNQIKRGLLAISMKTQIMNFKTGCDYGYSSFTTREYLDSCTKDDCLVIEIVLTVFNGLPIVVPPINIPHQLGLLLDSGKGADVTFEVNGQIFSAHKCILAARSPVFLAQFFGPMKEKSHTIIKIEDMEAPAFEALLHFIYNDSFPGFEEINASEVNSDTQLMAQHLLVAADRYDLERLRIICEKILCSSIDESNVDTLLSLSERHSCNHLKAACLDF